MVYLKIDFPTKINFHSKLCCNERSVVVKKKENITMRKLTFFATRKFLLENFLFLTHIKEKSERKKDIYVKNENNNRQK